MSALCLVGLRRPSTIARVSEESWQASPSRLFAAVNVHGGLKAGAVKFDDKIGAHAWNWVYLPSRSTTYWMEPQRDLLRGNVPFFRNRAPTRVGPVTVEL